MTLLYSIEIKPGMYLGLWGMPGYKPRTSGNRAAGRIRLEIMGSRTGGLHRLRVWPRKTMLAENALALADDMKGDLFIDETARTVVEIVRAKAKAFFGGASCRH